MRNIQNRERESVIGKEEAAKQLQSIKEMHSTEYHEMVAKFESERKRLIEQIDQLQERNAEIELSLKAQCDDAVTEAQTLREQLATSEDIKARAIDQVKSLESQKARMIDETEDRAK